MVTIICCPSNQGPVLKYCDIDKDHMRLLINSNKHVFVKLPLVIKRVNFVCTGGLVKFFQCNGNQDMDYCLTQGSSYDNEKAGTESLYCMALRYVLYYVYPSFFSFFSWVR